jgi:predicted transcriptional regulator
MPRNRKDLAAAVLEEIIKAPNIAPSRLSGRVGINYSYVEIFLQNGLMEMQKTGKRHAQLSITEKGRTFLQHYRVCNQLLPC